MRKEQSYFCIRVYRYIEYSVKKFLTFIVTFAHVLTNAVLYLCAKSKSEALGVSQLRGYYLYTLVKYIYIYKQ